MEKENNDIINHPKHYTDTCSLECIEAMQIIFGRKAVIDFCLCNAFKYLWRYKNKNGLEDIEKAKWYCNKAYEMLNMYTFTADFTSSAKEKLNVLFDMCYRKEDELEEELKGKGCEE